MQEIARKMYRFKKKTGTLLVILLVGELIFLPTLYAVSLLVPAYIGSVDIEFSVALIVGAGQYSNWTTPRTGASGDHINVLRAKKGFYFELESITFLYMGKMTEADVLIKRNDYTFQWFINHTIIRFRSEYTWEPEPREHFFGDFDNTLRELIMLQGTWQSNKLDHTFNQKGTASTPVRFYAYINSSPYSDKNVNLTAFIDRCGFFYITYALLWDRDYYYALESILWIIILCAVVDILVLLKRRLKTRKNISK